MEWLPYVLLAVAILLVFGAAALQTRANRRGWRTVGRIALLAPFTVLFVYFWVLVARVFQRVPGDYSDLALALVALGYLPLVFPALYPLASVWLRPRTAWIVPGSLAALSIGIAVLALRLRTPDDSRGDWISVLVMVGGVAVTAGLTWLACFLKNPRTSRPKSGAPDDDGNEAAPDASGAPEAPSVG